MVELKFPAVQGQGLIIACQLALLQESLQGHERAWVADALHTLRRQMPQLTPLAGGARPNYVVMDEVMEFFRKNAPDD